MDGGVGARFVDSLIGVFPEAAVIPQATHRMGDHRDDDRCSGKGTNAVPRYADPTADPG